MTAHLCLLGDAGSVHMRRWAAEMMARGFRVSVVTARPQPIEGAEQRVLSPVSRSADWLMRVGEARSHVASLSPDVVHAHYVTSYGYLAARCGRHPLLMTAWGSDILVTPRESRPMRWITAWTLRRADLITGDSQDLVAEIATYQPRGAIRQIHWGADMSRFRPVPWESKRGFHVVSLRSWEPNYNIDVIVQAVGLLRRRMPQADVHLHLLGGGAMEAQLREQVRTSGLLECVSFHGRVSDQAMVQTLQDCKVSVSVPTSDATSVSVLESMACGVPVVASDLPANRQWLEGETRLLIPPRDPVALAATLEALWHDEAWMRRIGEANHARMLRDGARSVQMDAMARLYAELLDRLGSRKAA